MEILSIQLLFIPNGEYILIIYVFTGHLFLCIKALFDTKHFLNISNNVECKNKFLFSLNYEKDSL